MKNSIIAELKEDKKQLISQIKSIIKNDLPISSIEIPSVIGFCWVFEEFGCYFLHRIVHIREDDTWDTVVVYIDKDNEIVYYNVVINPYIDEGENPCYQIDLESMTKFIHICKMME